MHKFEQLEVRTLASERLVAKLHSMRRIILKERTFHEASAEYIVDARTPFDEQNHD
jgi:hypothetical protein